MMRRLFVMKKYIFIFCACVAASFFCSCKEKTTLSIVSYNAQTFFDLIEDGREFKEFKKSKWKEKDYQLRLNRLLQAVTLCTHQLQKEQAMPDILVLQEIESVEILKDLCKKLKETEVYSECVFIPPKNEGAFSTAILSKHKVLKAKAHAVYSGSVALRPIIEAKIPIKLNGKDCMLALFAVHWKSKRDGNTAIRHLQEEALYNRMKEARKKADFVLSCGDFNQKECEFYKMNEFQNAWKLYTSNKEEIEEDTEEIAPQGSYCYKGVWERIDHFFYMENEDSLPQIRASKFALASDAPLVQNGAINRYIASCKTGYSDHLPIGLLLEVQK